MSDNQDFSMAEESSSPSSTFPSDETIIPETSTSSSTTEALTSTSNNSTSPAKVVNVVLKTTGGVNKEINKFTNQIDNYGKSDDDEEDSELSSIEAQMSKVKLKSILGKRKFADIVQEDVHFEHSGEVNKDESSDEDEDQVDEYVEFEDEEEEQEEDLEDSSLSSIDSEDGSESSTTTNEENFIYLVKY